MKQCANFCARRRSGNIVLGGKNYLPFVVHAVIPWAGHVNYAASNGGVSMLSELVEELFELAKLDFWGF